MSLSCSWNSLNNWQNSKSQLHAICIRAARFKHIKRFSWLLKTCFDLEWNHWRRKRLDFPKFIKPRITETCVSTNVAYVYMRTIQLETLTTWHGILTSNEPLANYQCVVWFEWIAYKKFIHFMVPAIPCLSVSITLILAQLRQNILAHLRVNWDRKTCYFLSRKQRY